MAVGSFAFTSATVNRSADVSVVADSDASAALRLQAQTGASETADGQIALDGVSDLNGGGDAYVTPDGSFVFGDPSAPSSTYCFSMTNQLSESRDFGVSLSNVAPSDGDIIMTFYDDTGAEIGSADKSTDASGMTLAAGAVAYCVVEIITGSDTTSVGADITITA